MRHLGVISCILLGNILCAQWEVPERIQLNAATPGDRQVTGLAAPEDPTDMVNADVIRNQTVRYGTATSTNNAYDVLLSPAPPALLSGMVLSFTVTNANTGPATLSVNGAGQSPIVKASSITLDSADLAPGAPHQVIYTSSGEFQLLSDAQFSCPTGYEAISRNVCIMSQHQDSLNWFSAVYYCASRNARLCTMGEWYKACSSNAAFLTDIVGYEWLDHGANDPSKAKTIGINATTLQPDCFKGAHALPNLTRTFRCCYTR